MATTSKIEQELLNATELKSKKDEQRQAYLSRLCRACAKVDDEVWEALSTAAQNWNNDAAQRVKDGGTIVDFPDFKEPVSNVDDESDEEAKVVTKPKLDKKKPEPKLIVQERKVSACHTIKKMVVKNPKITVAELSEQLKDSGLKVSDVTIATLRSDLRDTLRVLNELQIGEFVL